MSKSTPNSVSSSEQQNKNEEQKRKEARKIKLKKTAIRLAEFGAIILFASWLLENYLQKRWEDKKAESEKQRHIIFTIRNNLYTLEFQNSLFRILYLKDSTNKAVNEEFKQSCYYHANMLVDERNVFANMLYIDRDKYSDEWHDKEIQICADLKNQINTEFQTGTVESIFMLQAEINEYRKNHIS